MNCPNCNSPIISGSKFCGSCGNTLLPARENPSTQNAQTVNPSGVNTSQQQPTQAMQKKKSYKTWVIVAVISLAIYGYVTYAGQLSESKATDLISQKFGLPSPITYPLQHGLIRFSNYDTYNLNLYNALSEKKIVTVVNKGSQGYYENNYQIDLSGEGIKYKLRDSSDYQGRSFHILKGGETVFGGITGIKKSENGRIAEVNFTWGYSNVTPVGEIMGLVKSQADQFKSSVTCEKYEDGWRIKEGFNMNDFWDLMDGGINSLNKRR